MVDASIQQHELKLSSDRSPTSRRASRSSFRRSLRRHETFEQVSEEIKKEERRRIDKQFWKTFGRSSQSHFETYILEETDEESMATNSNRPSPDIFFPKEMALRDTLRKSDTSKKQKTLPPITQLLTKRQHWLHETNMYSQPDDQNSLSQMTAGFVLKCLQFVILCTCVRQRFGKYIKTIRRKAPKQSTQEDDKPEPKQASLWETFKYAVLCGCVWQWLYNCVRGQPKNEPTIPKQVSFLDLHHLDDGDDDDDDDDSMGSLKKEFQCRIV